MPKFPVRAELTEPDRERVDKLIRIVEEILKSINDREIVIKTRGKDETRISKS